jgi:DNA-directed RNA polymerase specialized sigma subunit
MAFINLRKYYDFYLDDEFVEVSDEIADEMQKWERNESSNQRKRRRYRDYYSLSFNEGTDSKAVFTALSPDEAYERTISQEQLAAALSSLTEKQATRICAYYIGGISKTNIATAEGVSQMAVGLSIKNGLRQLKKYFQKNFE